MSRFVALYRLPESSSEAARFVDAYRETHLPLVARTPGLTAVEVCRVRATVVGSPALMLMATLTFADDAAMDAAMSTPQWRASGRNLAEIGGLELATMFTLDPAETIALGS